MNGENVRWWERRVEGEERAIQRGGMKKRKGDRLKRRGRETEREEKR